MALGISPRLSTSLGPVYDYCGERNNKFGDSDGTSHEYLKYGSSILENHFEKDDRTRGQWSFLPLILPQPKTVLFNTSIRSKTLAILWRLEAGNLHCPSILSFRHYVAKHSSSSSSSSASSCYMHGLSCSDTYPGTFSFRS